MQKSLNTFPFMRKANWRIEFARIIDIFIAKSLITILNYVKLVLRQRRKVCMGALSRIIQVMRHNNYSGKLHIASKFIAIESIQP